VVKLPVTFQPLHQCTLVASTPKPEASCATPAIGDAVRLEPVDGDDVDTEIPSPVEYPVESDLVNQIATQDRSALVDLDPEAGERSPDHGSRLTLQCDLVIRRSDTPPRVHGLLGHPTSGPGEAASPGRGELLPTASGVRPLDPGSEGLNCALIGRTQK